MQNLTLSNESHFLTLTTGLLWAEVLLQLAIIGRVIMRRRPVGETLSWVIVVLLLPVVGLMVYLLVGELRLGAWRAARAQQVMEPIQQRLHELDHPRLSIRWDEIGQDSQQLALAGLHTLHFPAVPGNELRLLGSWEAVFDHLIADIQAAQHECDMEFYIWQSGGRADEVIEALIRASQRGVRCRILLDALGSRPFLRSRAVQRLQQAGVQVQAALPGGLFRLAVVRFDLRLHRKIVVIDREIAYTGSLNLVDPRHFKQKANVGQWIDAMVRVRGPGVEPLALTFMADWFMETGQGLDRLTPSNHAAQQPKWGESVVQVLPTGPAHEIETIEQLLITAIYFAREEVVLTTPYFVPSEPLQLALNAAASRGVKVLLVLPAKVDSRLVRLASRAFLGDLLQAGIRIAQFQGGLLHTKSVTVDRKTSLFGSLNLDPRSFKLNFEITLAIYDSAFSNHLRALQQTYLNQSELLDPHAWQQRPFRTRLVENLARLFSPLL